MLQPGRCPSSHFTEDSGVLTSSFGQLCSPDSRTSLRLLARFTAASWLSFTIDFQPYLRATHCPVRATVVVNTVIILTIDLAASSGRHTRQRHMPRRSSTSSSRSLPPSALQPRLHGASHLKDSEHNHRVEHHFTPPTRSSSSASSPARERPFLPLPSHRPHPRPTLFFIRRDSRTFPAPVYSPLI